MSGCSSPLPGRLDASRRAGARAEPTDDRPPVSRFRDQFWLTDFVRPPARGVAPQRRWRAAGRGGGERRRGGAEVGALARGGIAGVERYCAGIDRRMRRRVFGSLPVGTDNNGAAVWHHLGTGRLATDGKPRATRSRYGVAPSAAGNRRLLHFQGRYFACAVYRRRGADAGACTYTEEQAHHEPARWVQRQIKETGQPVPLRASSMLMHLEAIRAGTGRGVLPCYVGDGHPLKPPRSGSSRRLLR